MCFYCVDLSKKRDLSLSGDRTSSQFRHITSNIFYLFMRLPRSFIFYFPSPVLCRCSSQYTSVTMTNILLRYPLPRRHCAGMWWSCARKRVRQTATCLRCGGGQVRYSACWFILHSGMYHNFQPLAILIVEYYCIPGEFFFLLLSRKLPFSFLKSIIYGD